MLGRIVPRPQFASLICTVDQRVHAAIVSWQRSGIVAVIGLQDPERQLVWQSVLAIPARSAAATMMNPSASSSRNQFATVLPPLYLYLREIVKWRNPKRWNSWWSRVCGGRPGTQKSPVLEAYVMCLGMCHRPCFLHAGIVFANRAHKRALLV